MAGPKHVHYLEEPLYVKQFSNSIWSISISSRHVSVLFPDPHVLMCDVWYNTGFTGCAKSAYLENT